MYVSFTFVQRHTCTYILEVTRYKNEGKKLVKVSLKKWFQANPEALTKPTPNTSLSCIWVIFFDVYKFDLHSVNKMNWKSSFSGNNQPQWKHISTDQIMILFFLGGGSLFLKGKSIQTVCTCWFHSRWHDFVFPAFLSFLFIICVQISHPQLLPNCLRADDIIAPKTRILLVVRALDRITSCTWCHPSSVAPHCDSVPTVFTTWRTAVNPFYPLLSDASVYFAFIFMNLTSTCQWFSPVSQHHKSCFLHFVSFFNIIKL